MILCARRLHGCSPGRTNMPPGWRDGLGRRLGRPRRQRLSSRRAHRVARVHGRALADLASATATAMQLIPCSAAAVLVARAVAVVAGALVTARATTLLLFNKPHFRGLCALARSGHFCSSPCGGAMCCLSMRRAFVLATCCDYAMASGCPKVRGRRLHAHTSFTPPSHRPPAPSLCKRLHA